MSTPVDTCCEAPDLHWESRQIVDRFADVLACAHCKRTHKVEDWAVAVKLPGRGDCVNCGGTLGSKRGGRDPRCGTCGLTPPEARSLHEQLARLHPSNTFLDAAEAAAEGGRIVLAMKLATAHLSYVHDHPIARRLRLQGLESVGLIDEALDEAHAWLEGGGPIAVLSTIASLEAVRGNLEGTVTALERGLRLDPQDLGMWTDYAELQAHFDDREGALDSASYGLNDPRFAPRCLEVIATVAERCYAEDDLEAALDAVNRAGTSKQDHVGIAWLTARIAARLRQWEEAEAWLNVTLELDPSHAQAQHALSKLKPQQRRKKGWLGWLGGKGGS